MMGLTFGISSCLFILACYLLMRRLHFDRTFILALVLKVAAGVLLGLIYVHYYAGGDTWLYYEEAKTIAHHLLDDPGKIIEIVFTGERLVSSEIELVFAGQPRALFYSRILAMVFLLTGGNYWLMSAWLSFLNFLSLVFLIAELGRKYPAAKVPALYVFMFLPSFVFWSSGLLKECLAIAAMSVALGVSIKMTRTCNFRNIWYWMLISASCWLLWQLKYYYGAVFMPLLFTLLAFEIGRKWAKYRLLMPLIFLMLLIGIASSLHYNLNFSRVLQVVYENYLQGKNCVSCFTISYYNFDGSLLAFAVNMPVALFSGLFRPLVPEVSGLLPQLAAIENSVLLLFTIVTLWRSRTLISSRDPWVLACLIFIVSLATLLAFSTPNFGTLSRYKVAYWPYFSLLIWSLYAKQKKGRENLPGHE